MYTQCPHCQTCFRIAEAHLKVANGKVRCGSCQEIFDATQHLFKNLTDREPITDFNQPPPAPPPPQSTTTPSSKTAPSEPSPSFTPSPKSAPSQNTPERNHFNPPPTPTPEAVEKVLREREKAPDQEPFMESVLGNDRYNDLDQMGAIDIPGNLNFGDSIIKSTEEPSPPIEPEQPQETRTPYEDMEDKESPATTADHEILKNFFAEVDAQLHEDGDGDGAKSQLDKDIDELLAFAKGQDLESELGKTKTAKPTTQPPPIDEENFDLQAIAEFEKELETTNPGIFTIEQPEEDEVPSIQPNAGSETETASESAFKVEASANDTLETGSKPKTRDERSQLPQGSDDIEALPAPEDDIPRALRRSLEMLEQAPRRSLGKTILLSLLSLLLIGGLGFQIVLFRNVELAHMFPKLIPVLTQVCSRVPCRYSGPVDVSQIKLLNRDVRSDPNQANALLISATFVDQAPFDQPYPDIRITLYDLGGNVVASRRFTPKEYLEKMYNRFLLMESGTPVHITLAVLDPGKDAINFEFSFLRQ